MKERESVPESVKMLFVFLIETLDKCLVEEEYTQLTIEEKSIVFGYLSEVRRNYDPLTEELDLKTLLTFKVSEKVAKMRGIQTPEGSKKVRNSLLRKRDELEGRD